MAVVLTGIGLAVYLRFDATLTDNVDQSLRARAADVVALIRRSGPALPEAGGGPLVEREEAFAELLDARGEVVAASPQLRGRPPLLTAAEVRELRGRTRSYDRISVIEQAEPVRLLATPVTARGRRLTLVVGAAVDENEEALDTLRLLLALGGPLALLLASLAGYGVATGALRPVEAMRRKAAAIGDAGAGERLPVPPADDELGRLGSTLNEMLDRLEEGLSRERAFVSDASHELRTPLAILRTELELALRAGRTEDELRVALRSALEETDRLGELAEDLLVLARSDRGALPLRTERVDAREALEEVAERFASRASLSVRSPGGLMVDADRTRLQQALGNLVENALVHGGGEISLEGRGRDGQVELHVADGGPGFPPDFAERAFERFTRGDAGRTGGGAGLGLAIVQAIAAAHGGRARARNGPDGGADVWLELPSSIPHPDAVETGGETRGGTG